MLERSTLLIYFGTLYRILLRVEWWELKIFVFMIVAFWFAVSSQFFFLISCLFILSWEWLRVELVRPYNVSIFDRFEVWNYTSYGPLTAVFAGTLADTSCEWVVCCGLSEREIYILGVVFFLIPFCVQLPSLVELECFRVWGSYSEFCNRSEHSHLYLYFVFIIDNHRLFDRLFTLGLLEIVSGSGRLFGPIVFSVFWVFSLAWV